MGNICSSKPVLIKKLPRCQHFHVIAHCPPYVLTMNTDITGGKITGGKSKRCFPQNTGEAATGQKNQDMPGEQQPRSIAVFYSLLFFLFAQSTDSPL
ncbi:MAG: hypothetical protein D3904_07630 [Candidatus Electrothrix sp. EH2]|nr:hypothetical protein [Candidatus Electrothrix sp. EH2]